MGPSTKDVPAPSLPWFRPQEVCIQRPDPTPSPPYRDVLCGWPLTKCLHLDFNSVTLLLNKGYSALGVCVVN